jgi:hypothetical protein
MRTSVSLGALVATVALAVVPSAAAKTFEPGDLRLCNAKRCVPIVQQQALDELSAFYYGIRKPSRTARPTLRVPYYELRFTNGYATGIVATTRLDRFLSYGVNLDQFRRGRWYRVPAAAAAELRRLSSPLAPLRLTRAAIRKSR